MKDLKMILTDGTEVGLEEFTLPMHIIAACTSKEEVLALWDRLTPENLTEVKIKEDGETLFTFLNAGVTGQQSVLNPDNTITAHFYLDGERAALADPEYETAARILLGEVE